MTNPTPHGQVPEALRLAEEISNLVCSSEAAAKTIAAAADELCRLHVENASLRAQQPASPPAEQQAPKETLGGVNGWRDISTAPKDGSRFVAIGYNYGLYSEGRHICVAQWFRGCWMETSDWNEASELKHLTHWLPLPSPPDNAAELNDIDVSVSPQQAAPKAAPGVGNSGFDHQTAADFLNGKTVSDEAVRKFVAASRWAHDERAALSATLLAMHGVLTSREAEIALLKKALLEAEAAPQPAPAPLSDEVVKDAARWRMAALIGNEVMLHPDKRTHATAVKAYMDATHSGSDLTAAVDAAIAAQGGKT